MDSVRFGRVLGAGARLAGKTLAAAVDAATAPDPGAKQTGRIEGRRGGTREGVTLPGGEAGTRVRREVFETTMGVQRGGRRFGEAVWRPFARASGVLWLEVSGVFFGLVALVGLDGMWLNRGVLHWGSAVREMRWHFLVGAALAGVFGYFCGSSFWRAARRGRGP